MATNSDRGRRYEAVCFRCRDSFAGSEPAVMQWLHATRCAGAKSSGGSHDGLALAVYPAGSYRCLPRQAPCDHMVTAQLRDLYGRFHSHARRRFFLRGEGWSCCLPTSSYNLTDHLDISPCAERGTRHVVMPRGLVLPLSAEDGRCGIVCDRHSAELRADGATTTRL